MIRCGEGADTAIALFTTPGCPAPAAVAVVHVTLRPLILSGRAPPRWERPVPVPPRDETLRGLPMVLGDAPREESGEAEKTLMTWLEMWDGAGDDG